jgi:hypothetical protein
MEYVLLHTCDNFVVRYCYPGVKMTPWQGEYGKGKPALVKWLNLLQQETVTTGRALDMFILDPHRVVSIFNGNIQKRNRPEDGTLSHVCTCIHININVNVRMDLCVHIDVYRHLP